MDVLSALIFSLQFLFGASVLSLFIATALRVLLPLLPKPRELPWCFAAGAAYILLFLWLAHLAYFLDYYSCVQIPDVPNYEFECVGNPVGVSIFLSAQVVFAVTPYILLFYSVAFFVHHRMNLNSEFLRLYVATLVFIVVMLSWVSVFPWTLEHYLRHFY